MAVSVGGGARAEEGTACPGMDAAAMARYRELSTPGPAHRRLDALAGNWSYRMKLWMNPDAPPQEFRGTSENRWILGGRQLQTRHHGRMMGNTFEGIGILGYDNVREEYHSVWMDNMATGLMTSTARFDESENSIHERGSYSCPMTGVREKRYRAVWHLGNGNRYVYAMYSYDDAGREFKSMEIEYTRRRASARRG